MKPRITVIGNFNQASCWQLERLPKPGETLAATGFYTEPAGKGLAVAVGCHRLGAELDLLLSIGSDPAGDLLMHWLCNEGLSTHYVRRHPGLSGYGAGWLAADGENAIAVYRGANLLLDAAHVALADEALTNSALVYAQFEAPVDAARAAFLRARRQGNACTVLNPSPWQALDSELLNATQALLVNAVEAAELLPYWPTTLQAKEHPRLVAMLEPLWRIWQGKERVLVVTLGGDGSLAFTPDGKSLWAPALTVPVRSSIGAGDAFAAGFCTALAMKQPIEEALRRGNACGAFAVSHEGILSGLPGSAELQALLAL